jgi:hypothetical protein
MKQSMGMVWPYPPQNKIYFDIMDGNRDNTAV